jgi:prepilin-type N-terminal cleavage/methylation domain-containing protein
MKIIGNRKSEGRPSPAFTLVELLVVISIIALLAAFTIPALKSFKRAAVLNQTKAEMAQLETAIESYKAAYGFYPPGNSSYNPANSATFSATYFTPLYYELMGTKNTNPNNPGLGTYQTLDGSVSILGTDLTTAPAPGPLGVGGFINYAKPGAIEDVIAAKNFLPGLKANQIGYPVTNLSYPTIALAVIITAVGGPDPGTAPLGTANPWRYVNPGVNNPQSYDLWVQLDVSGKTNLVCNWNKQVTFNSPLP